MGIGKILRKPLLVVMIILLFLPYSFTSALAKEEAPPAVHGLKAEYYTNSGGPNWNFGALKATVIDPQIYFPNFERILENLTGQNDNASVRWTGRITPEFTEDYTFWMVGDNGFRLWIDHQLVIDFWVNEWDKEKASKPISLEAGKSYDFKVEYFEDVGGSNLYLRWSSPSVPKQIIPQEAFTLPTDFVYNGPINGSVFPDGITAELGFAEEVSLEEHAKDQLSVNVQGVSWPIQAVASKSGDPTTIVMTFEYPVYSKDAPVVNVSYDGGGALKSVKDGKAFEEFYFSMKNQSEFKIQTPWADDVDPELPLPEYPRPQMEREQWLNLNGSWEFQVAKEGDSVPTGQTLEEQILVPFAVESQLSGIERNEKLMWYKRTFEIPKDWDGQQVLLHFGAVDYLATVYVNGEKAGSHKGGFTSFSFDITNYLAAGENEIIVQVFDQTDDGGEQIVGKQTIVNPGGIWYTPTSGIWQTVWLEPVSQSYIERMDMVPDIWKDQLELKVDVHNSEGKTVEAIAYSEGVEVGRVSGAAGETLLVPVPDSRWWSPDDPFLYDLKVILKDGGTIIDEIDSYFGMREIKLGVVDGIQRPLLNGEFVFQMGPLDQGFWPDGIYTAPTDEALKYDIETVKRLDMNMIRKHIKVEPARWYYWADKLGVVVWQDMPNGRSNSEGAKAQFYKEFDEMVSQLQNSPSIVTYVVFNEGWGQFDQGGPETRKAIAHALAADPTRLIMGATGWHDAGGKNNEFDDAAGHFIDVHSYPAPNSPTPTKNRTATLGEYGGLGLHVPGHEYSPLVFSYQLMKDKEQLTNQYIQYINTLKNLKKSPGLSAAVYTQISDVEYEINGLLSYDRKVEKLDFERVAAAHRELIGSVSKTDLFKVIQQAKYVLDHAVAGNEPSQYPQAAIDEFAGEIAAAQQVYDNTAATSGEIKQQIASLEQSLERFLSRVIDPIPAKAITDQFDSDQLDASWTIIRENRQQWSLTENPGALTLNAAFGELHERTNDLQNVFLRNTGSEDFEIITKVHAEVASNYQQAGLLVYENDDNYVKLGHVWDTTGSTGKSLETAYEVNGSYFKPAHMASHPGSDTIQLKIKKQGDVYSTFYWDGANWKAAADPVTVKLNNPKVGLYAIPSGGNGTPTKAAFYYFAILEDTGGTDTNYDVNGDGRSSLADLAIISLHYGAATDDPDWESIKGADLNQDQVIDSRDIELMMNHLFERMNAHE